MNRDEGHYRLSHIYDELLLNKILPIRKSTGNPKTPTKKSAIVKTSSVSSRCFWNVHHTEVSSILFRSENERMWNMFTDM